MALVILPKRPENGASKVNVVAICQSTVPARIGSTPESKARPAETVAIGTAKRTTQRIPRRLTSAKPITIAIAIGVIGTCGKYQLWIADADIRAVRPQVGTQPH